MTKYGQQQSIAGSDTTCIPLAFEHLGFWGPMAEDYLDKISKISKDANGKSSETDFRDRWRKQLSVVVQSCNSCVIFKSCQIYLCAILMIFCVIKMFNILFIDCYCYAYIKLAIVIGRVRVQI